ncbi:MAG: YbeD family protein [Thiotrichales bacterium]
MNTPPEPDLFQFPCEFPIKIIGADLAALQTLVEAVLREHAPDSLAAPRPTRPSRNGRYLSMTFTVRAVSREQLDSIYRALTASEHVVWAL